MSIKFAAALACAALAAAQPIVPVVTPAAAATAPDDRYWGCDSGYDFQVSGEAGRCFKAAAREYGATLPCVRINTPMGAVGAALRVDANGETDVCATSVAGVVFTGEVLCGPGWTMDRRVGTDRCFKREVSDIRQPTRVVVR